MAENRVVEELIESKLNWICTFVTRMEDTSPRLPFIYDIWKQFELQLNSLDCWPIFSNTDARLLMHTTFFDYELDFSLLLDIELTYVPK